jgi:hypothetical protein
MIEVKVKSRREPRALAELIVSTLYDRPMDPQLAVAGDLVLAQKEAADAGLPTRDELPTVNFAKIDDDTDWSDV